MAPSENPVTRRGYHCQGQPGLVRVNLYPMDCQNPALPANVNGAGKLTQKSCPTRDDDWRSCLLSEAHPVLRAISAVLLLLVVYSRPASCEVPRGTWLLANRVAIQVFDCSGLLCGKIVWLARPRTTAGRPDVDHLNPDPKLRERPLCGLTILWGLRPNGPGHWSNGWLYDPHDGHTYNVTAELTSPNRISARVYRGVPAFGRTEMLIRDPHLSFHRHC